MLSGSLTYLAGVAAPLLVLSGFGLYVSYSEARANSELNESNIRLRCERVTSETERSVEELVHECLFEPVPRPRAGACSVVDRIYDVEPGTPPRDRLEERFSAALRDTPALPPGKTGILALNTAPFAQLFYIDTPANNGRGHRRVVLVNLDVVQTQIFPDKRKLYDANATLMLRSSTDAPDQGLFFRTLFPFWKLTVQPAEIQLHSLLPSAILVFLSSGLLIISAREYVRQRSIITHLLAGAPHSFRMPLTAMKLIAERLRMDPDLTHRARRHSEAICYQAEQLTLELDNLLTFNGIQSGRGQYRMTLEDMSMVLREVVARCEPGLLYKGFEFFVDLPEGPLPVKMDEHAVTRAILNLIDNAVKYSSVNRRIHLSSQTTGRSISIEVRDFGVGLGMQDHKHVFDAFYRGGAAKKEEGYGLGLFLVKHVMDAHGGNAAVKSNDGGGCTFRLIFPLCTQS